AAMKKRTSKSATCLLFATRYTVGRADATVFRRRRAVFFVSTQKMDRGYRITRSTFVDRRIWKVIHRHAYAETHAHRLRPGRSRRRWLFVARGEGRAKHATARGREAQAGDSTGGRARKPTGHNQ